MSRASEREVAWLSPAEERAWRGYRRMRTLLDLRLARDLAHDCQLSDSDYDVLSTVTEGETAHWRAGDLAERLLWSTSRLTHHVKRMEARGLVQREPCPGDGRGAMISLTDAGHSMLQAAAPRHVRSVREQFIDLLAPEEIDCLATISDKVLRHGM